MPNPSSDTDERAYKEDCLVFVHVTVVVYGVIAVGFGFLAQASEGPTTQVWSASALKSLL